MLRVAFGETGAEWGGWGDGDGGDSWGGDERGGDVSERWRALCWKDEVGWSERCDAGLDEGILRVRAEDEGASSMIGLEGDDFAGDGLAVSEPDR